MIHAARNATTVILLTTWSSVAVLAGGPIDAQLAKSHFDEAAALSQADGGKLWGRPLYGPMLFVDRSSRSFIANEPVPGIDRQPDTGIYVGKLPANVNMSNTATSWRGKKWTMVLWPLPSAPHERARLMAHELWHRIQNQLGLPMANPANAHLDRLDGRFWLRIEWRALRRALSTTGSQRTTSIEDAIVFRRYRRSLFPKAESEERALENNEGLAEYTGVMLAGWDQQARDRQIDRDLHKAETADSFARSFAYASGPPYGVLLDEFTSGWRRGYSVNDDFGDKLSNALHFELPEDLSAEADRRMRRYEGEAVLAEEQERDRQNQERLIKARARYLDGPTLHLPLRQAKIDFDPNDVQPLDDIGTVYHKLRLVDDWGTLETQAGALIAADWT